MRQGLRDFIEEMKKRRPNEVVHVRDEVDPKYEVTGIMLEAERHGHYPLFLFDHIKGSNIPLVTGVISHRKRFADALEVPLEQATLKYIERAQRRSRRICKAPFHANAQTAPSRPNQAHSLTIFRLTPAHTSLWLHP
jgi:UbiD family decarboxylase